ncbi:MAG: hypothetical protein RL291_164, partial [Pseudomonadota bacterium]
MLQSGEMAQAAHPRLATPSTTFDLVVVGGGPVGLALALAVDRLAAGELKVAVLERGQPRAAGTRSIRAVALATRSLRLLDKLGVLQGLKGRVHPVTGIDITDGDLDDAVRAPRLTFDLE